MGKGLLGAVVAGALTIATGGTFLGFTGITAGLLSAASSLVLSGLSSALSPKPKNNASGAFASQRGGDITRQVRQPLTERRIIYGEVRASGPYAFIGSTEANQYLHFVLMVASHEVEDIGEIWVNDYSIPEDHFDANGDVISGKYAGFIRITKKLGTSTQGAESNLLASFPEWTAEHRLQEIAYIYVRLKYDRNIWAGGIPNISAFVKGKKVFDQRTNVIQYSQNPVLILQDYLTYKKLGVGADIENINEDFTISGANACEEIVSTIDVSHTFSSVNTSTGIITVAGDILKFQTGDRVNITSTGDLPMGITSGVNYFVIPYQRAQTVRFKLASSYQNAVAGISIPITSQGTGTISIIKNAEARYIACGSVESGAEPYKVIEGILSSMAGKAIYSGGKWRILTGRYETPTIAFGVDDLAGSIVIKTKTSRVDRFNRVIGTYTNPLNNSQPANYPAVKNDLYVAQDLGVVENPFDLPFTTRAQAAQRIAKIKLEDSRQELIFKARFKLSAFKAQCGDVVLMNFERYGWDNKPFEVIEWSLQVDEQEGVSLPVIDMTLKETAPEVYDWNNGEETTVDPAPNTNLPNATDVAPVFGLSFDSIPLTTVLGDALFNLILNWSLHEDSFVIQGGQYEIQYKLTTETDYKPSFFVDGRITKSEIATASAGTAYDIRIRAVNNIGVEGPWNYLFNVVTGTGGGVTTTEDWGLFSDTVTTTEDWGLFSDTVTTTEDWEGF